MPQGGTYPDPECFWDAAVLQFVAPAEMRERESAETRRHFKAEPGSDHSFSDHQPFKLIWIAKSSAITKQNLVRIITGLKSYNWLDGLLLSKREGNTNLVKSTFLKWKLPFPHLNQHQCWVIASSKLQASTSHQHHVSEKDFSWEMSLTFTSFATAQWRPRVLQVFVPLIIFNFNIMVFISILLSSKAWVVSRKRWTAWAPPAG